MKAEELKEAVNGIHMDEKIEKEIIRNVKAQTGKNAGRKTHQRIRAYKWSKTAAAAAIVIAVLGVAAFPVRALVNSLVQERMEKMTEEEITAAAENVKNQEAEADSYSRAYTASEKERYQELYQQYKDGMFPEKEIQQVNSEEEAGSYEFCFLTTTSCFYLPDRELTDEELLEIIDFILKREYAFTQDYEEEHAEEIAQEKEREKEEISANVESGGISEQQAIETATKLLSDLYEITGENMELNHYYDGGEEVLSPNGDEVLRPEVEPYYCVNWSDIIAHQYYYFYISARDGRMTYTEYSSGDIVDVKGLTIEETESKITLLHKQAAAFMSEKVKADYEKEFVYYLTYDNGTTTRYVRFIFEKEDGSAYEVAYLWDGTFTGFSETDLSKYENGKTLSQYTGGEETEVKTIFRPVSQ